MSRIIWDGEQEMLVRELNNGKYVYRTLNGLAESTGLDKEKVLVILETLVSDGLVRKSPSNELHWALKSKVACDWGGF